MSIPRRPKSSSLTKRPCGRSSTLPCGKLSPRRERCPLMDFDQTDSVEIPVLTKGAVYREPKAMSNESYNPFRADYASDVSEPDARRGFFGLRRSLRRGDACRKGCGGGGSIRRDDPFCRVRSDRNGVHSFCRGTGAATADGWPCGLFQRCDGGSATGMPRRCTAASGWSWTCAGRGNGCCTTITCCS